MSFDASLIEISERYLRDQLAATQTARALCANPVATWEEIQALVVAGGIAEGETKDRIRYGAMIDDPDYGTVYDPTRFAVRQFEDDEWERLATSGFSYSGGLTITAELKVPPSKAVDAHNWYPDIRRKAECLAAELRSQPKAYPYLDITRAVCGPVAISDPVEHAVEFAWVEINVQFAGAD